MQSKQDAMFIEIVANHLAGKFIMALFLFSPEKNYAAYIDGMDEILDWATEFYDQYYDAVVDWEGGKLDGLITAFGHDRIRKYYAQKSKHACALVFAIMK